MKKVVIFLILLLFPGQAFGQTLEDVEKHYLEGRFIKAMEEGRALGTPEGLVYALRAQLILIQYVYPPEARMDALALAIEDADKADEMAPDDIEIGITTGILIGLRGKYTKSITDGKIAQGLFLSALDEDPKQSWALGALGSWHLETVAEAGTIGASLIMGAKRKVGYEYFERAFEVDPKNIALRAAYIRGLLKNKPRKFRDTIQENIELVLATEPENAMEAVLKEQVRQIDAARKTSNDEDLKILLDESQPLKMPDAGADGSQ